MFSTFVSFLNQFFKNILFKFGAEMESAEILKIRAPKLTIKNSNNFNP